MLKGHVFLYQIFGNEICAKVFDTFGKNASGILEGYGNSMEVTYNGSEVTISNGVALICGRPVQETSSTTIDAGTTNYYCKLVLTVDLDQENTSADFNQGYYEILTDANNYPTLTQDDIVNTNQGKYQFELARFTTGVSGIDNFVEAQNYLPIGKIINDMDTAEDKTINAPSIQAIKNYVDAGDVKAYNEVSYIPTSSVTNATTSAKDVGITLNITTTGKPLVVIMSLVGSVTAATVDFYLMMDGNGSRVASTNATSRERNTGFKVYDGLSAGSHTIKISFACSQGTRTATIPAYTTVSLLAFEI